MEKKIIVILFLTVLFCFAQEEISMEVDSTEVRLTELVDTIAELDTIEISDSISNVSDTVSTAKNKKVSWYFTLSPRVGVDKIQKEYSSFLKERSDSIFRQNFGSGFRQNWFQPANASGVSFYFETGVATKINDKSSIETGAGYSFNQMRSVYNIEGSIDSIEVLRMRSLLVNNSLSLSIDYKMGFDSSYFNIKGIDVAGFYAGGAFVLSRFFERDTINSQDEKFVEQRRKNYDGFGGSGRVGLFAQRKIGRRSVFEYSIGYFISAITGYESFWDNRKIYWEDKKNHGKILSISNNFEMSFSLIF